MKVKVYVFNCSSRSKLRILYEVMRRTHGQFRCGGGLRSKTTILESGCVYRSVFALSNNGEFDFYDSYEDVVSQYRDVKCDIIRSHFVDIEQMKLLAYSDIKKPTIYTEKQLMSKTRDRLAEISGELITYIDSLKGVCFKMDKYWVRYTEPKKETVSLILKLYELNNL